MKQILDELEKITVEFAALLPGIAEEFYLYKPGPAKWSKKEILGHLIDSAQNNIRRFVVAQYEDLPSIAYRQDDWVRMAGYQDYSREDLISLWVLLNRHLYRVLSLLSEQDANRKCKTSGPEPRTIAWLAADYNKHLRHHLHQIMDLEAVAYP